MPFSQPGRQTYSLSGRKPHFVEIPRNFVDQILGPEVSVLELASERLCLNLSVPFIPRPRLQRDRSGGLWLSPPIWDRQVGS